MLEELVIHIAHDTDDGWIANPHTYGVAHFCGRIPAAGDMLLDRFGGPEQFRRNPSEQTVLQVLRTAYSPTKPNVLVLLVSERVPYDWEEDWIKPLL